MQSTKAANTVVISFCLSIVFILPSCIHAGVKRFILPPIEDNTMLSESWDAYKKRFVQFDGRVIDWFNEQISTSEGQSYALLRSVWIGDRGTFDTVLNWTLNNLHKTNNHLFAWKWGQRADKSWGIIENVSAADGDEDIAFALSIAYDKWGDIKYRELAINIIKDIWSYETILIKGVRYLTAGDWVKVENDTISMNPSYFAPYAYRVFASIDASHNWLELVDTSYDIIYRCSESSKAYLPPDWCMLNKNGEVVLPDTRDKKNDTSYDAFRTYWRLAFDYMWFGEKRAYKYIKGGSAFLTAHWIKKGKLADSYAKDGAPRSDNEAMSIYGMLLPSLAVADRSLADEVYNKKIIPPYRNGFWGNQEEYYSQNWVWFGVALFKEIKP